MLVRRFCAKDRKNGVLDSSSILSYILNNTKMICILVNVCCFYRDDEKKEESYVHGVRKFIHSSSADWPDYISFDWNFNCSIHVRIWLQSGMPY